MSCTELLTRPMPTKTRSSVAAFVFVIGSATFAQADVGVRVTPDDAWKAWSFDPLVLFTLITAGVLYHRGHMDLQRRTDRIAPLSRAVCFYAALGLIGLILLSPLDALSQELSAAHMVQHMLIMLLAAPLFVLAAPATIIAYAMPPSWQQVVGLQWLSHRLAWHPIALWTIFAITLWGWHHPVLYHAALRDPLVHDAQHLSFFLAAFLFWRIALDPVSRRRLHPMAALPFLFTTSLHASALGIFLTLAPAPWYDDYAARTAAFGLTPLVDQQLAGLFMWVPGCLVYPIVAMGLVVRWLTASNEIAPIDRAIAARGRPRLAAPHGVD